jgi:hypothetical protein
VAIDFGMTANELAIAHQVGPQFPKGMGVTLPLRLSTSHCLHSAA